MGKMNAAWHKRHVMPKNPSVQQRIKWHTAHAANCGCRPVPKGVLALMVAGKASARRN